MNFRYIPEPSLQFGQGQHICPRQGIFEYNPFDIRFVRPEKITIGIVGKSESIEKILQWIEACKSHIDGKKSKNPHPRLFPNFCGFNRSVGFCCEVVYDVSYIRKLNNSELNSILTNDSYNLENRIEQIAALYLTEIKYLSKNKNPDVILCVLDENFIDYLKEADTVVTEEDEEDDSTLYEDVDHEESSSEKEQNFRRYLKARSMQYNVPIQIVRDRIGKPTGEMQDPATIAWNFFTALYYKSSGTPWALIRKDFSETTCYAGVSFFRSRDKKSLQTSIAQIFNELGNGVILRGEEVRVTKKDRIPHLTAEQAYRLLAKSLREYHESVKIFPQRLVLHKSSNFNEEEIDGFVQAARELHVDQVDLITIRRSEFRIYREGEYPPLRGTHMALTDAFHILYTRGSVPFYETYPGKYIPRALEVIIPYRDESQNLICDEILSLTKMNWNNTQFDRLYPITIECARNVGEILKYLEADEPMQLKYSFYM